MSRYTPLLKHEGVRFMPSVWNFCFKPLCEDSYFVEPWNNREHADCAEFRLTTVPDKKSDILFFVKDPELVGFLIHTKDELYIYGAYNQINVCQMRARGSVEHVPSHPESAHFRQHIKRCIDHSVGRFSRRLSEEEVLERYSILAEGQMFCFYPTEYAYATYDRG